MGRFFSEFDPRPKNRRAAKPWLPRDSAHLPAHEPVELKEIGGLLGRGAKKSIFVDHASPDTHTTLRSETIGWLTF